MTGAARATAKLLGGVLLLGLSALLGCRQGVAPPPADVLDLEAVDGWLAQHEPVNDHPYLERARSIFDTISRATLQRADLQVRPLSTAPEAMALVNEVIVITPAALDLCFEGRTEEEGAARFAFLAGHELAHLKFKDFWHLRTFGETSDPELKELVRQDGLDRQQLELKADGQGALAALDAGYDPHLLVSESSSFFAEWLDLVPGRFAEGGNHPLAAEREEVVRLEVARILARIGIYDRAIDRMDRAEALTASATDDPSSILEAEEEYRRAVRDLEEFRIVFDGRRVLANLAAAHLRIASGRLLFCEDPLGLRLHLRSIVDEGAVANRRVTRGIGDASDDCTGPRYTAAMTEAIDLLRRAIDRDPYYFEPHWNLGMAYLLDRQTAGAKRQAELLLRLDPDDPRSHEIDLLADLLAVDMGNRRLNRAVILADFVELHRRFPDDAPIAFNLASALTHDPEHGLDEALPVWRRFVEIEPTGPWAEIAREWLGETSVTPETPSQPTR